MNDPRPLDAEPALTEAESTVALDQDIAEAPNSVTGYRIRCTKAVEWVEKNKARLCPYVGIGHIPDRWICYVDVPAQIGANQFTGPTWLAAVELAMKETP